MRLVFNIIWYFNFCRDTERYRVDERGIFIDYVDTEWCFRALSKGYKLYMSEKAVMRHSVGDDTINLLNFKIPVHSGYRRYYRVRNLFSCGKCLIFQKF